MKKIVIVGVSFVSVLGLVAFTVMAQGPGFGRGFGPGPGYIFASLTAEQSAKIQSLQQAHLQAIAPIQQELLAKRTELQGLSLNPSVDPSVIGAKQKEIWTLRSNLQEMGNNLRLQIRQVLTPEQQGEFDSFGPRRGMGPRMGRGFGPGFGPGGSFGPGFGPTNQ